MKKPTEPQWVVAPNDHGHIYGEVFELVIPIVLKPIVTDFFHVMGVSLDNAVPHMTSCRVYFFDSRQEVMIDVRAGRCTVRRMIALPRLDTVGRIKEFADYVAHYMGDDMRRLLAKTANPDAETPIHLSQ